MGKLLTMKNRIKYQALFIKSLIQPKQKLQTTSYKLQIDSGFTIVELLIYMGLLAVMILIFTDIFTQVLDNQKGSRNTSNVADDGRYIYSRFIYDINRADSIVEPTSFGSTSANLVIIIDGITHAYSASEGGLTITTPTESNSLSGYGSSISGLLFTKVGSTSAKDTVRMNFTVSGKIAEHGVANEQVFQTTAGLR